MYKVFRVSILLKVSTNESEDSTPDAARGVFRHRRDVKVQIHFFLEGFSHNSSILDGECHDQQDY